MPESQIQDTFQSQAVSILLCPPYPLGITAVCQGPGSHLSTVPRVPLGSGPSRRMFLKSFASKDPPHTHTLLSPPDSIPSESHFIDKSQRPLNEAYSPNRPSTGSSPWSNLRFLLEQNKKIPRTDPTKSQPPSPSSQFLSPTLRALAQ